MAMDSRSAELALDDAGRICDCDVATEMLFRYPRSELVGRHVSVVLPELKNTEVVHDGRPSPRLHFLCHIGRPFQVLTRDGQRFASELFFNRLDYPNPAKLRLIIQPRPSRNAELVS